MTVRAVRLALLVTLCLSSFLTLWRTLHQHDAGRAPRVLAFAAQMTDERFMVFTLTIETRTLRAVGEGNWLRWSADGASLAIAQRVGRFGVGRRTAENSVDFINLAAYHLITGQRLGRDEAQQLIAALDGAPESTNAPAASPDGRLAIRMSEGNARAAWDINRPELRDTTTGVTLRLPVAPFTFRVLNYAWKPAPPPS